MKSVHLDHPMLHLMFVYLMLAFMLACSELVRKTESTEIVFYTITKEIPPDSKILHSVMEFLTVGSSTTEIFILVIKIATMESTEIFFYTTTKEILPNSTIRFMLPKYSHGNGEKLFGGCLSLYDALVVSMMIFFIAVYGALVIKNATMESTEIVSYTTTKGIPPPSKFQHTVMEFAAVGSSTVIAMLQIYSRGNGEKLFGGCLSLYHALVVSLMFTFTGAVSALVIEKKPKLARLCRWYSLISGASALVILAYPIYLASYEFLKEIDL